MRSFQQDLCGIEADNYTDAGMVLAGFQQDLCGIEAALKDAKLKRASCFSRTSVGLKQPDGTYREFTDNPFQQDLCGIEANRALGGNP